MSIAVFDSGVGGISVLKSLVEVMPNEDFIYTGIQQMRLMVPKHLSRCEL